VVRGRYILWCSRMARDELAPDGIHRAGDTKEIGTDIHSQCSTNRFPYLSPDCGLSPVMSFDFLL
jgi:hypothetical protein